MTSNSNESMDKYNLPLDWSEANDFSESLFWTRERTEGDNDNGNDYNQNDTIDIDGNTEDKLLNEFSVEDDFNRFDNNDPTDSRNYSNIFSNRNYIDNNDNKPTNSKFEKATTKSNSKHSKKFIAQQNSSTNESFNDDYLEESDDEDNCSSNDDEQDDSTKMKSINDDNATKGNDSRSSYDDGADHEASKRKVNSKSGKMDEQDAKAKNREHAKNTRMRKKNYIESLKDNIKQLAEEREKYDRERKISLSRLAEQTVLRKKVLQTLFSFRSTGEINDSKWETILEESFELVMPITPYRSFPPSEVTEGQRHVKGIDAVILDTASFDSMIQSITTNCDDGERTIVQYYTGPDESVMNDNTYMCKWHMTTTNAMRRGSRYEVTKNGMAKAIFSTNNKLLFVELSFDVMSFMQQLRRSSGKFDFLVIPNTPSLAMEETFEARMITEACSPHIITYVNQSFVELFGYIPDQVVGFTCSILQGKDTEKDKIDDLMKYVHKNLPCSTTVTNYTIDKQKFRNWIRIYPLYTDGKVSHFLGVSEKIVDRFPPLRIPTAADGINMKLGSGDYETRSNAISFSGSGSSNHSSNKTTTTNSSRMSKSSSKSSQKNVHNTTSSNNSISKSVNNKGKSSSSSSSSKTNSKSSSKSSSQGSTSGSNPSSSSNSSSRKNNNNSNNNNELNFIDYSGQINNNNNNNNNVSKMNNRNEKISQEQQHDTGSIFKQSIPSILSHNNNNNNNNNMTGNNYSDLNIDPNDLIDDTFADLIFDEDLLPFRG